MQYGIQLRRGNLPAGLRYRFFRNDADTQNEDSESAAKNGGGNNESDSSGGRTFNQSEVDSISAKSRRDAETKVNATWEQKLGGRSIEDLLALADEADELKREKLTTTERLETDLATANQRIKTLESELAIYKRKDLQQAAGIAAGLAPEFWGRIAGENEDEMNQDAENLAQLIGNPNPDSENKTPKPKPPPFDAKAGGTNPNLRGNPENLPKERETGLRTRFGIGKSTR